jgi:hypothetical protein
VSSLIQTNWAHKLGAEYPFFAFSRSSAEVFSLPTEKTSAKDLRLKFFHYPPKKLQPKMEVLALPTAKTSIEKTV